LRLLICVLNDGAYGAEIHKLRQGGLDESGAVFCRTDFGVVARGFGLRGSTIADLDALGSLMKSYDAQGTAEIWNIPISDRVTSPSMRRLKAKGHGVM
jgi:acetolactate synthase-1/2/3 large subunit